MNSPGNTTDDNLDQSVLDMAGDAIIDSLLAIRSSFLVFIAVLGVFMVLLGAFVLDPGVLAGLFGIWGITAILYAGCGFILLRLIGYR